MQMLTTRDSPAVIDAKARYWSKITIFARGVQNMLHYDLVGRQCLNSNNVNRLVLYYALCIALAITPQSAVCGFMKMLYGGSMLFHGVVVM